MAGENQRQRDFHTRHMLTDSPEQSAALAINNGCDLNCGSVYQQILAAYEHGAASRYVTVLEGIQDYLGDGVQMLTSVGCELSRDRIER